MELDKKTKVMRSPLDGIVVVSSWLRLFVDMAIVGGNSPWAGASEEDLKRNSIVYVFEG
jgi:hypothetical protein